MRINPRLFAVVAAVTLVVGSVVFILKPQLFPKAYGKVGNYVARAPEVEAMIKQNQNLDTYAAVTVLLDLHLFRQVASKLGLNVTDEEVTKELQKRLGKSKLWDKLHLSAVAETQLLRDKLALRVAGNTRGRVVIIHFEQHFYVYGRGDLRPGETEARRPQYIAADRAAADALKDSIYQKLQNKTISFDQAMQMELDDPKVGPKVIPTTVHSRTFNTADKLTPLSGYLDLPEFKKLFSETAVNSYSAPTLIKLQASDQDKRMVDSWWVIVQVDGRDAGLADSLEDYMNTQKKILKYEKTL